MWVAKDLRFLQVDCEDSEQTGWMPRLILVFAGRRGHFVGFVGLLLNYECLISYLGHDRQSDCKISNSDVSSDRKPYCGNVKLEALVECQKRY